MVNVPSAVWIDEAGRIVRPTEVGGESDAFRTQMDRKTKQVSAEGIADRQRTRTAYLNALRDWTAKGADTPLAVSRDEVRRRSSGPSDEHVFAAAHFRLGEYLYTQGHREAALPYFSEARRLHPASWNYRRQTWELEEPGKAGGPEFWAAVDALGDRPYYPPRRCSRGRWEIATGVGMPARQPSGRMSLPASWRRHGHSCETYDPTR